MVFPINGKDGRYYKKKVLNSRGIPAYPKLINVNVDGEIIQEWGYFDSNSPDAKCVSHKSEENSSSSSSSSGEEEKTYTRKKIS
jgi:hypothetical protein